MPKNAHTDKRYCPNCYAALQEMDNYCGKCGQKYTTGKVKVYTLIKDFFESVFNFDARLFLTLRDLFVPGKLTQQYFRGKHKRYIVPVRLFFIMAVLHFAVLNFVGFDDVIREVVRLNEDFSEKAHLSNFHDQLDTARINVENSFAQHPMVVAALDSLESQVPNLERDSFGLGYMDYKPGEAAKFETVFFTYQEIYESPIDTLVKKSGAETFIGKILLRQSVRFTKEGQTYTLYVLGKLIWVVVLMMPALALFLRLLYVRRHQYYVEHLVFSFHYHAFAFLIFSIAILWADQIDYAGLPILIFSFVGVMVYQYTAMKRYYGQGRIKTFIKFSIVNFSYLFLFTVFLTIIIVMSALLY